MITIISQHFAWGSWGDHSQVPDCSVLNSSQQTIPHLLQWLPSASELWKTPVTLNCCQLILHEDLAGRFIFGRNMSLSSVSKIHFMNLKWSIKYYCPGLCALFYSVFLWLEGIRQITFTNAVWLQAVIFQMCIKHYLGSLVRIYLFYETKYNI